MLSMFYVTAGSQAEAENLAEKLVKDRLVACINIIPQMKSFFYWEGGVQWDSEVILIGKTRSELIDDLVSAVNKYHSYDVPCVLAWDVDGGNPEFLDWIKQETKQN